MYKSLISGSKVAASFLALWVMSLVIIWRTSALVGRSTTVPVKLSLSERRIIKFSSRSSLDILLSLNKSSQVIISGLWVWRKYANSTFLIRSWMPLLARRMVCSSSTDTQDFPNFCSSPKAFWSYPSGCSTFQTLVVSWPSSTSFAGLSIRSFELARHSLPVW